MHPPAHSPTPRHATQGSAGATAPRQLPAPVGALLSRLPAYPGSVLLVTALNLALAPQPPPVLDPAQWTRRAVLARLLDRKGVE